MITNRGTFQKINLTIPTDDFLDIINEFDKDFLIDYFAIVFKWIDEYQQYVSEIITPLGLCFTFNIAPSHELMDTNLTSDDFHYIYAHKEIQEGLWNHEKPPQAIKRISTSKSGLWIGFQAKFLLRDNLLGDDGLSGFQVLIHDPFELPTTRSKMIKLNTDYETQINLIPQLNTIDESLFDYDPAE